MQRLLSFHSIAESKWNDQKIYGMIRQQLYGVGKQLDEKEDYHENLSGN